MNSPKTILIDMDAIVADLASEWYGRWNDMIARTAIQAGGLPPAPLTVDDVHNWDVAKVVGDGRIYSLLKSEGLYRSLKPFPAAIENIKYLNKNSAFKIFFVTASITAPHILADKAHWMAEHFPFINPKQMIYAYHKELVRGDFFIDDSPKNLKRFKEAQPNAKLITIDYPYNKTAEVDLRAVGYKDMNAAWIQIFNFITTEALESMTMKKLSL
jgi:5'(3')-deoxyribonucleotidase